MSKISVTGYVVENIAGRALVRYFGLPIAAALGVFSTYQTIKSHRELKKFDAKYIEPLKEECDKWEAARSQLEGAVHELQYYERIHYPQTRFASEGEPNLEVVVADEIAEQQKGLKERHDPDPKTAYDLVARAQKTLKECKDEAKDGVISMLNRIETTLYKINNDEQKPNYSLLRKRISKANQEIKYVISDYSYDISKFKKERDTSWWKWGLMTGASFAGSLLGIKALRTVTTRK